MKSAKRRRPGNALLRRFTRSGDANMATLTALTMPVLFAVAAFAIDEGSLFLERRELQAVADIAAIEAAAGPGNAELAAGAALAGNGIQPIADGQALPVGSAARGVRLSVEAGAYKPDPAVPAAQRFTPGGASPNAARVRLVATGTRYFAGNMLAAPTISVAATAARMPRATLSVGSRLAGLDKGVLNETLGALTGSSLSLSAMDYEALAGAQIGLLGLLDALRTDVDATAVTYQDLLASRIGLGTFVAAIGGAGGIGARAEAALRGLERAFAGGGRQFALGSLLDLGPYDARRFGERRPAGEPAASALDLLSTAALLAVADGRHQVALGLRARVGQILDASATLTVGEPPQGTSVFNVGDMGIVVRTAQLRLLIRLRIAGGTLPAAVEFPLAIELAPAEARIAAISCPAGTASPSVTVEARPGVAHLAIGEPGMSWADWTKPASYGPARLLDASLVKITGAAQAEIASRNPVTLRFSASDIRNRAVKSAATSQLVGSLTGSLLADLRLQVGVIGLSLGLGDITRAALTALLAQASGEIDSVIDTTLALLGIRIGEADISVTDATCGRPALVQ